MKVLADNLMETLNFKTSLVLIQSAIGSMFDLQYELCRNGATKLRLRAQFKGNDVGNRTHH